MTRIPATTDPRGRRPARVPVPSSQLGAPALGNVSFGSVPPSPSGTVGAALAGAVGGISAALLERNLRMQRAVRARQRTELSIGNMALIESAREEAAKADPEHAEATFRNRLQERELEISQIEDEDLRDQASLDFLASSERGAIVVRRAAAVKQAGMQRAAMDTLGGQLRESVRLGELDPQSAIEEFESRLVENGDAFSPEDLVNARQAFTEQIRVAHGQMVRARLTAFSVDLLDKYEDATSDDERADIIADFGVAIEAAVEAGAIAQDTGVDIDQNFQSQADARIKDKISSIARRATSRLLALDSLAIEALVEEANTLPDSQEKIDLLIELDSKLKRLNQSKGTGQEILDKLFGDRRGELPQDRLGLNAAYQTVLAANGDVAEFARLLSERGSVFPSDLLRDVSALTDEGTKNLQLVARIFGAVGTVRARDLATASSDPNLALAAMDATPSELDLLSGPLVPEILEAADLHFQEDERKKIEGVDIQAAVKSAFKQKITPNTEQLAALKARYFIRFAEFRVTLGDTGDDEDVAQKAAARAADDLARDFEPVAGVLIRKTLIDDLDVGQLARAVESSTTPFRPSPLFGIAGSVIQFFRPDDPTRLDLLFRANGKVYVPIVTETGPSAFIEVDPLGYKSRRIERGTDDFTVLENRMRSNVAPVDFDPFSDLQWREEYGATSIQEYDEQFGADFGGSLYLRTQAQLAQAGLLDGLSPEQQKQMIDVTAQNIARKVGWDSVLKPVSSGE